MWGRHLLDADHHTIHEGLERNAETANAFIRTLQESEDKQRFAADAYCDALANKIRHTLRSGDPLSRADVTWVIPTFYARYWAGGTVSISIVPRLGRTIR